MYTHLVEHKCWWLLVGGMERGSRWCSWQGKVVAATVQWPMLCCTGSV
jgi:hypothetical protein